MANHLFDQLGLSARPPGKPFLVLPDGSVVTYGDALLLTGKIASALQNFGVGIGDRVAVQAEKTPLYLLTYLACVRAGAVFVPLNTAYTEAEVNYFIGDAEPSLFIADPARKDAIGSLIASSGGAIATLGADGSGTLHETAQTLDAAFKDVERRADDLAAILYTSGTTGRSKGAMLSHENLASNARTLVVFWRFTSEDKLLHALPIFHTHGLFVATNTLLMAGGTINFLSRFEPDQMIEWLGRSTAMMGVPTFYVRLLQSPRLDKELTRGMRLFISGSAPLLAETHVQWSERTGHAILERYGMTETNMLTSNPYDGPRVPGAVGPPLPGVDLRITNPLTGEPLGAGQIGMIEVRGPNVFSGYWRNKKASDESFRADRFFITGDLGKCDDAGYVHIVGRDKDLVITGGFNVYPIEVESEIDALDGVIESAVFGLPHQDFGEGVTAAVVRKPDSPIDEAEVRERLKERLANFKLPKRVVFVEELPRNAMGKVQKNVLREMYRDLYRN